jgi:hypothetical protein
MERLHYLADPDVRGFTAYLRSLVIEGNGAALHIGRGSRRRPVATLLEAQQAYRWRGRDFRQVSVELERFRTEMQQALTVCGGGIPGCTARLAELELLYLCIMILEWGNSLKGVLNYVSEQAQAESLSASLARAAAIIDGDDDDTEPFRDPALRSGPRIGKLYAVMNDQTVTYGGRLAAALCLLCRHHQATRPGPPLVPDLIDFPLTVIRPARNPSVAGGPQFRRVVDACEHARWNIRANWLLDALSADPALTEHMGGTRRDRMRRLEAGLFMIGDDVRMPPRPADRAPATVLRYRSRHAR